jgi:choline dehydrogenase-like flavoprotein
LHFAVNLDVQAGTGKMGPICDQKAVVDQRLRVYNLLGIRVMPTLVTGEVQGTSMMIGEKGADLIKQDWLANPYCRA